MADYRTLKKHYEKKLKEFGPNARGMDWPNEVDLRKRFKVLSDVIGTQDAYSLLDLGCGVGLLIDHLKKAGQLSSCTYLGADISEQMIEYSRELHPGHNFEVRDILKAPYETNSFDYVIMNGLLTEKQEMTQHEMVEFAQAILTEAFGYAKKGIAFNIMSSHVDWKRDDLFHWELDALVAFLVKSCSRHIRIHMDYGLYEYTVHVMKEPRE
ncbi:MAG: class I SAM-dependent methyltransferase [Cryomorphaceae bacterium]